MSGARVEHGEQDQGSDGEQEPLHLLPLGATGAAEPDHHRGQPLEHADGEQDAQDPEHRQRFDAVQAVDPDRVVDAVVDVLAGQGAGQHAEHDRDRRPHRGEQGRQPPPAGTAAGRPGTAVAVPTNTSPSISSQYQLCTHAPRTARASGRPRVVMTQAA